MGTGASPAAASDRMGHPGGESPAPNPSPRKRTSARVANFWPNGLVLGLLAAWLVWFAVILTHPLHPTRAAALLDPGRLGTVQKWAFVEPSEHGFQPIPALVDPVAAQWEVVPGTPVAEQSGSDDPIGQAGWIAWQDELGTHVADLRHSGVRVHEQPGPGISSHVETRAGRPSIEAGLPADNRADDLRDLWNGGRLLGPSWLIPSLSVALAFALLWGEPRFRTRWSWFWILGAPLGLGMVWMLLREQWYGTREAPTQRPGGWSGFFTSFALSVLASMLLSGLVATM